MPPLTRWFIKISMIYLVAGLLVGLLLAARSVARLSVKCRRYPDFAAETSSGAKHRTSDHKNGFCYTEISLKPKRLSKMVCHARISLSGIQRGL
ncbi:MAG TPA: hypothetical protein VGD99_08270 [Anaerolineae bacterium]|jgi:hypothetical protein